MLQRPKLIKYICQKCNYFLKLLKKAQINKILDNVKISYNHIADEFSDTRQYSWDDFNFFKPYLFENAEIIDLGCGNGRLINFLDQYFLGQTYRYIGFDNSDNLLEKAHQLHPQKVFLPGDQLEIPLSENQADLVFNIAAFHHIPSANLRRQALMETKRVLKPGGILIMTVWNLWQTKYLIANLKAWLSSILSLGSLAPNDLFIPWKNSHGKIMTSRYYHNFLPWELKNLVKKSGFKILKAFPAKKGAKSSFLKSYNYILIARNE